MIPVTFNKDDLNNGKKGTIRAQDLASLVGLLYPKKVGVLNMFSNPLSITDKNMSTGYVSLTFNKGYVVVYGRLIYVEQGEVVTLPLPASTERGYVGIRINLGNSGSTEVEWFRQSGTLRQDNLLDENVNGVYELPIYTYSADATTFNCDAVTDKVVPIIPSLEEYMAGANFTTQNVTDNSNRLATTQFVKSAITSNNPTYQVYTFGGSNYGYILRLGRIRIYGGIAHASGSRNLGTISFPETLTAVIGSSLTANVNIDTDYDTLARITSVVKRSYTMNSITFSTNNSDISVDFLIVGIV